MAVRRSTGALRREPKTRLASPPAQGRARSRDTAALMDGVQKLHKPVLSGFTVAEFAEFVLLFSIKCLACVYDRDF